MYEVLFDIYDLMYNLQHLIFNSFELACFATGHALDRHGVGSAWRWIGTALHRHGVGSARRNAFNFTWFGTARLEQTRSDWLSMWTTFKKLVFLMFFITFLNKCCFSLEDQLFL